MTLKHSWTSLWMRWSLFLSSPFCPPSLWNIISAYVTQFVSLISILNSYDRDINFPDLDFPKWSLVIVECWNTVHSLIKPLRRQNMANLKTLEKGKDKNKLNSLIQRFKYLFFYLTWIYIWRRLFRMWNFHFSRFLQVSYGILINLGCSRIQKAKLYSKQFPLSFVAALTNGSSFSGCFWEFKGKAFWGDPY